jgi:hypothetical protein
MYFSSPPYVPHALPNQMHISMQNYVILC